MERTIEDIIRDAEIAYKVWCERLETLEYDERWNEDEINIIQEAFKAEYEKKRAAVINELKQRFEGISIAENNSEKELTIREMRDKLYDYCNKVDCGYCVMKDINCSIEKMSDTQVITYYNMIEKESKKNS